MGINEIMHVMGFRADHPITHHCGILVILN